MSLYNSFKKWEKIRKIKKNLLRVIIRRAEFAIFFGLLGCERKDYSIVLVFRSFVLIDRMIYRHFHRYYTLKIRFRGRWFNFIWRYPHETCWRTSFSAHIDLQFEVTVRHFSLFIRGFLLWIKFAETPSTYYQVDKNNTSSIAYINMYFFILINIKLPR